MMGGIIQALLQHEETEKEENQYSAQVHTTSLIEVLPFSCLQSCQNPKVKH
jgi:hypothetical protein